MLYLIGIGLSDEKDITIKGLETLRSCDLVYLDSYTSRTTANTIAIQKFYEKQILLANREFLENNAKEIIDKADKMNVAVLVVGDPLAATTHVELMMRARENSIPVKIIHNASILTAVGVTGLQLYKFGKTASIPFPEKNFQPETAYEVLEENRKIGAHTLILLDLRPDDAKYMTVNEAITILSGIEEKRKKKVFNKDTLCVGCAGLGTDSETICFGRAEQLLAKDFGQSLQCLVIPGKLHFIEEDMLRLYSL